MCLTDERQPRQRRTGESVQRAQYPNYPQYPLYGQTPPAQQTTVRGQAYPQYGGAYQDRQPNGNGAPAGRRADRLKKAPSGEKPRGDVLWLVLIILCVALLIAGGFTVNSLYSRYPAFRARVDALAGDTFMNGVHVDGIHIGGMTMEQARAALHSTNEALDQQYALSVTVDGKTWRITQSELPLQRNTEGVLAEAFSIGRQTDYTAMQSGLTPFQYRSQAAQQADRSGAFLYTQVTYDKGTVRELADKLSAWVSTPAQDAKRNRFRIRSGISFPHLSVKHHDVETGGIKRRGSKYCI